MRLQTTRCIRVYLCANVLKASSNRSKEAPAPKAVANAEKVYVRLENSSPAEPPIARCCD